MCCNVGWGLTSFLRGERKKQNKFHQISTNQPIKELNSTFQFPFNLARNCLLRGFPHLQPTARQYGEVVLPDAASGQTPGTRQLAGHKAVTVQACLADASQTGRV